jgi:predicted nucleotidyltransferase component of viral defense system
MAFTNSRFLGEINLISSQEIVDAATASGLTPHVVEKDYVLGWLLWGINASEQLSTSWVFKGGTCLKKCFFETYRFSEDLDFTLKDESHIDDSFLQETLSEVCDNIYEHTGIEFPEEMRAFKIYENPRGQKSCQGRIAYRGPVSPPGKNAPRIKLDLTADEVLVLPPAVSPVYHPYSDAPSNGIAVTSYSYEEAFGEKIRALGERTRPRDLYDVINLYRNDEARPDHAVLLDVLMQKCDFKGIDLPNMDSIRPHRDDLAGSWNNMLEHQLPVLPPLQSFWDVLPEFFNWLVGIHQARVLAPFSGATSEEVLRARTGLITGLEHAKSAINIIRFAASNRLLVSLQYQGSLRLIEPYSLRRTNEGNIILHAHNVDKDEHRSYRVDRIQGATVIDQTFVPRHQIELNG